MKKFLAILMSLVMLFTCSPMNNMSQAEDIVLPDVEFRDCSDFESLEDPALLQYLEDTIYSSLEAEFVDSDVDFVIDEINAIYVSKEYLEEVAYNTKANIFFGYNLAELNQLFQGKKYVFTLDEDNQTGVQEFLEIPDDTEERFLRNIAIGTGIILLCVTVTVITAGMASGAAAAAGSGGLSALAAASTAGTTAAKISVVFAASAKSATTFALSSAALAGTSSLIIRGAQTGWDMEAMTHDALLNASDGFKYGAIAGAVIGGIQGAHTVHTTTNHPMSPREAEKAALEAYGGREQVAFKDGKVVSWFESGSVRPDVVVGNEVLEVKCIDLADPQHLSNLGFVLRHQISQRMIHLPPDMTQRIVLNVEGRGYTETFVKKIVTWIKSFMEPIYPDIPIDIMGTMLPV